MSSPSLRVFNQSLEEFQVKDSVGGPQVQAGIVLQDSAFWISGTLSFQCLIHIHHGQKGAWMNECPWMLVRTLTTRVQCESPGRDLGDHLAPPLLPRKRLRSREGKLTWPRSHRRASTRTQMSWCDYSILSTVTFFPHWGQKTTLLLSGGRGSTTFHIVVECKHSKGPLPLIPWVALYSQIKRELCWPNPVPQWRQKISLSRDL